MGKHGLDDKETNPVSTKAQIDADSPKKTKRRNINRDILSYENVPIDRYERYSKRNTGFDIKRINKQLVKRIALILVVIFLLFITVFLISNRKKLTRDNISLWFNEHILGEEGDGFPVSLSGTSVSEGNFVPVNGRPCYASDTSYIELNSSAGEIINSQISFTDPVIRGTRNITIVYGAGSNGYMIHNSKKRLVKGSTDDPIYTADVNDSGRYIIVTGGADYLSVFKAYSEDNKQIYSYSFADYYVTCAAVNEDGDGAVCCGITTENGAEKTKIYVLDFQQEKTAREYDLPESVIYDIFYLSDNTVSAIADNSVYTLNLKNKNIEKYDYKNRLLTDYTYDPDTGNFAISLSRSGDGHNCDIVSFDSSGEEDYTINSNYRVNSISLYKGDLGILSDNTAYILDKDGKVDMKSDAGNDARTLMLSGSDTAYVLGISEVRKIFFE